jgi:hypothetical protein
MSYTLATAAAAAGVNKTAKDEHGEWRIEPAELHRVSGPLRAPNRSPLLAEARLADLKATLDDMRSQRDRVVAAADRLTEVFSRLRAGTNRGREPRQY